MRTVHGGSRYPSEQRIDATLRTLLKANWKSHKGFCNALPTLEKEPSQLLLAHNTSESLPLGLEDLTKRDTVQKLQLCERILSRETNVLERNLLCWEPRCLLWWASIFLVKYCFTRSSTLIVYIPVMKYQNGPNPSHSEGG